MSSEADVKDYAFLEPYLDENKKVNYELLEGDPWLKNQVDEIEVTDPSKLADRNSEFAFWLNTYNILVLNSVLLELKRDRSWNGTTSVWKRFRFFRQRKFQVGKRRYSLFQIENDILRKKFADPRIHFALNCGASSCPYLPGRKFKGETLDSFLDDISRTFVNTDQVRYDVEAGVLYLNMIFSWYKSDFGGDEGIINFINKYRDKPDIPFEGVKLSFNAYNWGVNKV